MSVGPMTPPEAGDPDGDRLAVELLRHLQAEPGLGRAAFDGPPVRLTGGSKTQIYASGSPVHTHSWRAARGARVRGDRRHGTGREGCGVPERRGGHRIPGAPSRCPGRRTRDRRTSVQRHGARARPLAHGGPAHRHGRRATGGQSTRSDVGRSACGAIRQCCGLASGCRHPGA